jgi:hypothetical protein
VKKTLGWVGAVAAGLLATASIAMAFVSSDVERTARASLEGARELLAARVAVAEAEKALGGSDIGSAIASAREANARAEDVGSITADIVASLRPTGRTAKAITESSKRSAENVGFTRRQAAAANDLVGAVAGYQHAAARLADRTNDALQRILQALRRTNRSFPNPGPP